MGKVGNQNVVFLSKVTSYNHNRSSTFLLFFVHFCDYQVHKFKLVRVGATEGRPV